MLMDLRFRALALCAVLWMPGAHTASAQSYPAKPVRFIIPFPPGGPTDILGRVVATRLAESWAVPVVPDNRPGAGGNIGTEQCARSPADGYTVCMLSIAQTISPSIYRKLAFDPVRDLAHVSLLATLPSLLVVHPSLPVRSVKQLIALDKARPGELNYSSGGAGTGPHLATEVLKAGTGMTAVHIAYKGAGPALTDLVAGQVQFQLANMIASLPLVNSGRLRAIAVSGAKRSRTLPDVPTLGESGIPGFEEVGGHMIMIPGRTPREIVARLHQELVKVLQQPAVKARLESEGAEVFGTPPDQAAAIIRAEIGKWGPVINRLGLKGN